MRAPKQINIMVYISSRNDRTATILFSCRAGGLGKRVQHCKRLLIFCQERAAIAYRCFSHKFENKCVRFMAVLVRHKLRQTS